jgi:hypothetical protein
MSTPNLIDSALSQQAAALPPATPNTSESSNLINKSMGLDSAPAAPAAPQVQSDLPANSSNLIDASLKTYNAHLMSGLTPTERTQSQRQDPENQIDEPWYSKTWDWMNKPLYDAHQWGVRTGAGTIERGVESGVEDLISGLTSPLSIGLTVATLGGGTVLRGATAGLKAIGVAAGDAPVVARGLKVLMDSGFTAQALHGLVTQSPQFLDALKDGDYETAARLGTNITAVGALTTLGAKHTFEDAAVIKDFVKGKSMTTTETLATAKKLAGVLDQDRALAGDKAKKLSESLIRQLKAAGSLDEVRQGAIRKWVVTGGDTNLLKQMHDALDGTLRPREDKPGEGPSLGSQPVPKTKDFGSKANFDKFISEGHDVSEITKAGYDSYKYTDDATQEAKTVSLQEPEAKQRLWNNDYVYHATDKRNADLIRNAGIKGPKQKVAFFTNSPEEALRSGVTPVSGNRADLRVFAVPRSEVEAAQIPVDNADIGARQVEKGKFLATNKTHMPSHEIVLDDQGLPTGQTIPLRGDAPLTLDNTRFESGYTSKEKEALLAKYKAALALKPEEIEVAKLLRRFYDEQFNRAHSEGMIREAVENYHPQAWAKDRPSVLESLFGIKHEPTDNSAYLQLRHQTDNGAFDTNITAAKHRAFQTEFQGEMAGYKPKTWDIAYQAADYQNRLDRAIAARRFLESMRASGAKAADGRPLVALSGSSRVVGQESQNPALLVNPQSARQIQISNDIIKSLMVAGPDGVTPLQSMVDGGKIEQLPWTREVLDEKTGEKQTLPAFAWSTDGYQSIDHPSMRGWQYVGQDTGGNPALLHAQMRVHPEAAEYVRQVVGADVSRMRQNPYVRALMAAQRETKGALLSFSPFHAVQEGLRGVMLGINPFDVSPVDFSDSLIQRGIRNNLTFPDYHAEDMFSEGNISHSKLIGKIPVAGRIQGYIQDFTFNKLIPSLKARAFKSVYSRFLDKMPGSSADEVAHASATYVNDVFGGQHWRDLGVSATGQDVMRAVALAPDWLTSEIRMLWRAAGGMGKPAAAIARGDMTKLVAGMFITARVVNMLTSGKAHPEAPFGLVVPGQNGENDKVYSMRTLPTDLVHVLTDPRQFLMGRVNPLIVRTAIEGLTGRDQFGRKVTGAQEFKDVYTNFVPIGGQAILKGNTGGLTTKDQLIKSGGFTVYKYRTEAEKLAQEKASDHMPSGPVDASQLAAHQRNIRLEDGLRSGDVSRGQVRHMLPAREAEQLIDAARMTPLQARFTRLPLKDALDVWELATPTEKDELHSMLWKKRVNYIQSHTASQRSEDPAWMKMKKVMADLSHAEYNQQSNLIDIAQSK